ncbi:unnamed protein product [Rhodiola kirilowii]
MAPSKRPGKELAHSAQRGQSRRYLGQLHRGAIERHLNEPLNDGDEVDHRHPDSYHTQPYDGHGPYEETDPNWEASAYEQVRRAVSLPLEVVGDNSNSQPKCGRVSRHGMLNQHSTLPLSPHSHSRGHNFPLDRPLTDFVRKGSSTQVETQEDYPPLDPKLVEMYQLNGIKHTRQLIRPVEPSSFSPQLVEKHIRSSIWKYFKPDWNDLEDVNAETFIECFDFFKFVTKWTPDDDESVRKCFRNKCAEVMREPRLSILAGKSKEGPNKQSAKDMTRAGKAKQGSDWLSREDVNQQEYYSSADPTGNAHSKNKRAKRQKLLGDQNMHVGNISGGHDVEEVVLKNEYCIQRRGTDVPELPKHAEDGFKETRVDKENNRFWDHLGQNSVTWDDAPDEPEEDPQMVPRYATALAEAIKNEIMKYINGRSFAMVSIVRHVLRDQYSGSWDHLGQPLITWDDAPDKPEHPQRVRYATVLAEAFKNELMDEFNAFLPSVVRHVLRHQHSGFWDHMGQTTITKDDDPDKPLDPQMAGYATVLAEALKNEMMDEIDAVLHSASMVTRVLNRQHF